MNCDVKKMAEILSLNNNSISNLIHKITELYHEGEIEGLVIGVKLKDGEFACGFTDTINFLEKLGLCQAIINDIQLSANEES
jgi:hypothetical protein